MNIFVLRRAEGRIFTSKANTPNVPGGAWDRGVGLQANDSAKNEESYSACLLGSPSQYKHLWFLWQT